MEAFREAPYYGWDSSFFVAHPEYTPTGTWSGFEGAGISASGGNAQVKDRKKVFVIFPSVLAGMEYKANYINRYNGDWPRWHSTIPSRQEAYKKSLLEVRTRFVDEFEKEKK
ncbi:hypothetical protein [Pseudomonas fluorescens]|uniref:hypothetical protein n=1 Tax=Pseudomonas fluorescens TaxID=294 RepID=UPI003D22ED7F